MARASLRFGLGRFTTAEEIEFAIDAVADAVERLRSHSAAWAVHDRSRAFDPAIGRFDSLTV